MLFRSGIQPDVDGMALGHASDNHESAIQHEHALAQAAQKHAQALEASDRQMAHEKNLALMQHWLDC